MAAPKNNQSKHNESCREKIQTTQLLKRLQDSVLSEGEAQVKELTAAQLKAIEILLKKSLPDLSSITHEGGTEPIKLAFSWLPTQN
jgi:hypothetical protein